MILPHLKAGGAERVVSFLFKKLDRSIFEPHLLVIGSQSEAHYFVEDGNVLYLNKKRLRSALYDIVKIIRDIKPAIVFSSIGHINIYLGFLKIFFLKTKFVAREASVYSKMSLYNERKQLPFSLLKSCYQRLDALVYQSVDMKKDFQDTFKLKSSKGYLIHNPITFPPSTLKNPVETSTSSVKFLIVGSLVQNKGHERVLNLFEKVKFDFTLEIIGEGPLRVKLESKVTESKIRDKVIFRGIQKNMPQIYAEADFLIQGSFVEGFPNVVLEALSYGIPCVVFDSPGGHREMIKEGENGFFIYDETNAIDVLQKAVSFQWQRGIIQKDVINRFGSSKILKQYEDMLKKVLST